MKTSLTANYIKRGKWYLGWVEEVPGVNTQGRTLAEVKDNLHEALSLVIETNRILSKINGKGKVIREIVSV